MSDGSVGGTQKTKAKKKVRRRDDEERPLRKRKRREPPPPVIPEDETPEQGACSNPTYEWYIDQLSARRRELNQRIDEVIAQFARAARLASQSGFHGVEIQAGRTCLLPRLSLSRAPADSAETDGFLIS